MNSAERFREYMANARITPIEPAQKDSGRLQRELDAWKAAPIVRTTGIADDPELMEMVAHELNGLTTGEWISKFGLGKVQVSQMSKSEISAHCRLIEANLREDAYIPSHAWKPRVIPQKFAL